MSTRSGPIVYVAQRDGSGAAPFDATPAPFAGVYDLAWSPSGTKLVYRAIASADEPDALVVDDGTVQTTIATGFDPVWSPSGTRIAFDDASVELTSVAIDGRDLRTLGPGTPLDWRVAPVGTPKFPNLVQRPLSGLVLEHTTLALATGFTSMVTTAAPASCGSARPALPARPSWLCTSSCSSRGAASASTPSRVR